MRRENAEQVGDGVRWGWRQWRKVKEKGEEEREGGVEGEQAKEKETH